MACNPAAEVQGPGPNSGDGNPIDVNVLTLPPVVIEECVKVEGCPGGDPVIIDGSVLVTDIEDGAGDSIMDAGLNAARVTLVGSQSNLGAPPIPSGQKAEAIAYCFAQNVQTNEWEPHSTINIGVPSVIGRVLATAAFLTGLRSGVSANIHVEVPNPNIDFKNANNVGVLTVSTSALYDPSASEAFGGTLAMQRSVTRFKTAQAIAAGNTALWVPTVGTRFRLMRYLVEVTGNASIAGAGAVVTISLFDGAAGATGQAHDVFVPLVALAGIGLLTTGWIDLGNGYLSVLANNVLNINLTAALLTGNVRVTCCGTEE